LSPSVSPLPRVHRLAALLAVLQVVLLASSLLLAPALVIAQDADASVQPAAAEPSTAPEPEVAAEPAPAAEAPTPQEPAPEPVPAEQPKAEPEATPAQEPAPEPKAQEPAQEPKVQEPEADKEPKADKAPDQASATEPALEVAPAEPELKLVIDSEPRKLDLVVGEMAKLSAWLCPPGDAPFGPDEEPATADDACAPAQDAAWSVDPASAASLGKDEAAKVRLTADAPVDEAKVIAELGDAKDIAKLSVAAPQEPEPQIVAEPKDEPAPEVVVEEPVIEQPKAEAPGMADEGPKTPKGELAAEGALDTEVPTAVAETTQSFLIEPAAAAGTWSVTDETKRPEGTGTNGTLTFTVRFVRASNGEATATVSTANGTATGGSSCATPGVDYISNSAAFRTPTGNSGFLGDFSVTICGDSVPELDETFSVVVNPSPSTNVQNGTGTIIDDDVATSADLSVTKSGSPDPVVAGADLTYTITVANAGPSAAQSVSLADSLPAGTTFVSLGQGSGPAFSCTTPAVGASGAISCDRTTLAAAATQTFTLVVTVGAGVTDGTLISNTATVASTTTDPTSANDTASATTTVATSADLSVTKSDSVDLVTAGDGVTRTFTITVANNGPSDAGSVILRDVWPAGYTLGAIATSQGTCSTPLPDIISCPLGDIAVGGSATVTVSYTVPASTPAGPQTNEAVATSRIDDPNASNNTASDTNTVTTSADLSVTKSAAPAETVAGGTVTYALIVSNNGPSDASSATLTDTFPATLQGITVVDDGPYACGPLVGTTLTCTIASHPVGVLATITVTGTVVPGTYPDDTVVSNTAAVSSTTTDPNPANNAATAAFKIRSIPVISVTKTATPTTIPEPGGDVSFAVSVTNPGNVAVSLTSLVDNVQGDLNGTGTCAVPQSLAPGATYACSFTAFVGGKSGKVETDVVTAKAATSEGRQASASDDATVTITDIVPAIAVTKTASVTRLVEPGGNVTFTVTIQNLVPESLTVVALGDDLLGDLNDPRNPLLKDNSCANSVGTAVPVGATYECSFTTLVTGKAGDRHLNTVTVTVTDDEEALLPVDQSNGVDPSAVTVISATAQALIRIVTEDSAGASDGDTSGGGGGDKQPPTDTLLPAHSASASGDPLDGSTGWALWVLVTASVIVSGAWVIRRVRTQEI